MARSFPKAVYVERHSVVHRKFGRESRPRSQRHSQASSACCFEGFLKYSHVEVKDYEYLKEIFHLTCRKWFSPIMTKIF